TITVSNGGPNDAQNVSLTDLVPAGTTFVSETQTGGPAFSCTTPTAGSTGTITCSITTLASGASATFVVVVQTDPNDTAGTVISNTAGVSTTSADANAANNSSTVTTTVVST